jgi:hypothetical protein
MDYDFPETVGNLLVIIPTDKVHHFSDGYDENTNQPDNVWNAWNPPCQSRWIPSGKLTFNCLTMENHHF